MKVKSQDINNISVSHVLKTLTESMKKRNASEQDIAIMQKEFLEQFGINVSDIFIDSESISIQNGERSDEYNAISDYLDTTDKKRICSRTIWNEALKRQGKPSKAQTTKIARIVEDSGLWKKIANPYKDEKYGTQRGWERIGI